MRPAKGEKTYGNFLQVTGLTKVYGKRGAATRALDGVDLSLEAGEYVGIMGASGSGKTTLLNCVSTIDKPTSGSILVEGRELTRLKGRELTRFRREQRLYLQDCNLLDTLTAFENIALSLSIVGTPAGEIRPRVEETAQLLGIGDCLDKYPYQMSGGRAKEGVRRRPGHRHPPHPGAGRRAHRGPGLQVRPHAAGAAGGAEPGARNHHPHGHP